MALASSVGMLLGLGGAAVGIRQGRQMEQEALRKLEAFEYQTLKNSFESLKPSLAVEETALNTMSEFQGGAVDVAQGSDASTAIALMSNVNEQLGKQRLDTVNRMMDKVYDADVLRGKDEGVMRGMTEARDQFELQGLIDQMNAGRQEQADALFGAAKLAVAAGTAKERRLAGLGYDPYATSRAAIDAGNGTFLDFVKTGDLMYFLNK